LGSPKSILKRCPNSLKNGKVRELLQVDTGMVL
jgi:hypothetical protein